MPTINAGASTAVTVAVGTYLEGTGAGMAVIGPAAVVEPLTAGDAWQVGPFDRATLVSITAGSPITYTVRDNMRDPSEADKLSLASVAAMQALVSGDGHSGYVFYLPGRQQVGVPVDRSGKGRNAIRKAGLSEAASWAVPGFLSSIAATDGSAAVVNSACAADWATEVLVVSARVKMAAPGANAAILGTGADPTPHGFYISARTTGRLLLGISSAAGFYNTGEISGVVLDSTEHAFGFYIDGPNKNVGFYIDGGLAFTATAISPFSTASNLPPGFAIGTATYSAGTQTSVASTVRELHMLKLPAMPLNMDDIMLQLATGSGRLLQTDVKVA